MQKHDYSLAAPEQIEGEIGEQIEAIRLSRNLNQTWLANEAGVSRRTISRLENGQGVSLDTLIRVLQALSLAERLEQLLPDVSIQPVKRVRSGGKTRRRARMGKPEKPQGASPSEWSWGDEK